MKLKEYIENLQKHASENPESLELDVIYSTDDEGNGYQLVGDWITEGNFNGEYIGDFISIQQLEEEPEEYEDMEINAICIN